MGSEANESLGVGGGRSNKMIEWSKALPSCGSMMELSQDRIRTMFILWEDKFDEGSRCKTCALVSSLQKNTQNLKNSRDNRDEKILKQWKTEGLH